MAERSLDGIEKDDFLDYVLYVKEGDPNCEWVISLINQKGLYSVIQVVDATKTRPQWLRAVPTLHVKPVNNLRHEARYEGVNQISQGLGQIQQQELSMVGKSHMNSFGGVGGSSIGGAGLFDEGMWMDPENMDKPPSQHTPNQNNTMTSSNRGGGGRAARRAQNEASSNAALEQYKAARANADQRFMAMNQQYGNMSRGGMPQTRNVATNQQMYRR
jgi:hypothetical protein